MKLRLAADALRLRILRSELATLEAGGTLREVIRLAAGPSACITYSLSVRPGQIDNVEVACVCGVIQVSVSQRIFAEWCSPLQVGIYAGVQTGADRDLQVVIEKDFACLDAGADNRDTFEHPQPGAAC